MGRIGTRKSPVIPPKSQRNSDTLVLLNGTYEVNYNRGGVRFRLKAKAGKLTSYEEFYKNGTLKTFFDYTSSCGGTDLHWCIYEYKKDGTLKVKTTLQTPSDN